ncbi:hypothetical protein JOM56_009845 [Amanita muscaria]
MLSDLIVESQRWEVVDVEASFLAFEAFCLPNQSNYPPLLRSMALRTRAIFLDKRKCWELFLNAHNLTRVELDMLPGYDFDWSRLTVLTLHDALDVADVLPVLRRLRCIEKLQLKADEYFSEADEEQDVMIASPTLKVLSCSGNVLCHLRAPALEELHVDASHVRGDPLPLPDGAISFLRTLSGSLTRLMLGTRCCIDSDAKRILQVLPNVTKLCLEAPDFDLLDVLPYNLEEGIPVLPMLELLIVDGYQRQWNTVLVETLYATVASRTRKPSLSGWPYGAGKLKELRMINYEKIDNSCLRFLCEEREVKYLAFGRLEKAGHI